MKLSKKIKSRSKELETNYLNNQGLGAIMACERKIYWGWKVVNRKILTRHQHWMTARVASLRNKNFVNQQNLQELVIM